jgi:hypothetical protein
LKDLLGFLFRAIIEAARNKSEFAQTPDLGKALWLRGIARLAHRENIDADLDIGRAIEIDPLGGGCAAMTIETAYLFIPGDGQNMSADCQDRDEGRQRVRLHARQRASGSLRRSRLHQGCATERPLSIQRGNPAVDRVHGWDQQPAGKISVLVMSWLSSSAMVGQSILLQCRSSVVGTEPSFAHDSDCSKLSA